MKKNAVIENKQRKPGDLFKEVTGRAVTEFANLKDMETAVEKKLGHKLPLQYFNSSAIPRRGDVFPHTDIDMKLIDAEIDRLLQKA